VHQAG